MPTCLTPTEPTARPNTACRMLTIICSVIGGLAWLYAGADIAGVLTHQLSGAAEGLILGLAATTTVCAYSGVLRSAYQREVAAEHQQILDRLAERDYFSGYADGARAGMLAARTFADEDEGDEPNHVVALRANGHQHARN